MKHLVLALVIITCAGVGSAQDEPYTLVLGLSPGHKEFACPDDHEPCKTYCDLASNNTCSTCDERTTQFYHCITAMMKKADKIIFLVDYPYGLDGRFHERDELCTVEDIGQPADGQHTRFELCIVRNCQAFHDNIEWYWSDGRKATGIAQSGLNTWCPP